MLLSFLLSLLLALKSIVKNKKSHLEQRLLALDAHGNPLAVQLHVELLGRQLAVGGQEHHNRHLGLGLVPPVAAGHFPAV